LLLAGLTLSLLFLLESPIAAQKLFSVHLWGRCVAVLGGQMESTALGPAARLPAAGAFLASLLISGIVVLSSTLAARRRRRSSFSETLLQQIVRVTLWGLPMGVWTSAWLIDSLLPSSPLLLLLALTLRAAISASLAGWLWEVFRHLTAESTSADARLSRTSLGIDGGLFSVLCAAAVYVIVFVGMNWGLWWNLQIPHGDSSMYEEHLWNFLHGKGFRSYLDQGLFLGEHIQFIHLFLLPLYVLWPSHLLLELCESIALALTAIPAYFIARRHTGSAYAAALLAIACLLYFPLHYLDISIDLKTFRPSSLAIPLLLWGIDAAERRRWGWMAFCLLLTLTAQEDFAVTIAPLGLWLLCEGCLQWRAGQPGSRAKMIAGGLTCLLATVYVIVAVKVAIPWFRGGETVHYARYFKDFGHTPVEIVSNILLNPRLLLSQIATAGSVALFLDLLLPLGMPLRAWSRLLVAVPLFVLLCLNELTRDYPGPFHHFHAPLVPIVIWAACASFPPRNPQANGSDIRVRERGLWVLCCAFATGIFFSMSPLGLEFWDSGSAMYWRRLYLPDERAREFSKIPPLIPKSARVASTDFVHPRFTHYERSYDYSHYPRRVANYEDKVPDDTDYIVIDTGHRYSEIHRLEDVRELRTQPGQWEVVPVDTHGYFIVLKRIRPQSKETDNKAAPPVDTKPPRS
jgi:uncharacterized membrane protein